MPDNVYTLIEVADGCRSAEGARFLSQLRDGHRALREGIEGLTAEDLAWQHAPGFNTIGMLLAHIALSEVHLIQVGVEGAKTSRLAETLGIGEDDDGMPIAADGAAAQARGFRLRSPHHPPPPSGRRARAQRALDAPPHPRAPVPAPRADRAPQAPAVARVDEGRRRAVFSRPTP